jgi:hypothetical protein
VDGFALALQKGQTLVASLTANQVLGSPMDAVLQIVSPDGFVLAQNHDHRGLDPQIVFTAPADGSYRVRLFAFPAVADSGIRFAGGENYIYRLTLTTAGFADHAFPLAVPRTAPGTVELVGWNIPEAARKATVRLEEPERVFHPDVAGVVAVRLEPHPTLVESEPNDRQCPQAITLPATVSGRIEPAGDVDIYQFEARKGQKLVFQVEARALGFPLDPVLRLTDAAGKVLAQVDDTGGARDGPRDAELAYLVTQDGTYRLEVRDLHSEGGRGYVYRLRATLAEPDFDLTLAADRFVLTPGKPLEIPVTVVRRNGLAGEIEIRIEGLPEGVTAPPVTAGPAAKTVSLKLSAATGGPATAIRIVGRAKSTPDLTRTARASLTGLNAAISDIWLGVLKAPAK